MTITLEKAAPAGTIAAAHATGHQRQPNDRDEMLFALLVLVVLSAYSYFIYPVVLALIPARKTVGSGVADDQVLPRITLIITAHNEEGRIRDALRVRDVAPVPSAGIHPGVVPRALADYGNDVILNAGTGIMDHPDGPRDGVLAFFEALEHHHAGGSFAATDVPDGPLRRALEKWG